MPISQGEPPRTAAPPENHFRNTDTSTANRTSTPAPMPTGTTHAGICWD